MNPSLKQERREIDAIIQTRSGKERPLKIAGLIQELSSDPETDKELTRFIRYPYKNSDELSAKTVFIFNPDQKQFVSSITVKTEDGVVNIQNPLAYNYEDYGSLFIVELSRKQKVYSVEVIFLYQPEENNLLTVNLYNYAGDVKYSNVFQATKMRSKFIL